MLFLQRLLFVVVLVVASVSACPRTEPVRCPSVEVVQDFSFDQYSGDWFEIERSQADGACVSYAFTSQLTHYPLRGVIRHLDETSGEYAFKVGEVRLADPLIGEGKLKIKYSDVAEEADYWVVDTDYTSFALVYSCRQLTADTVSQRVWVLGRQSELAIATKRAVDAAFGKSGLPRDLLAKTRQDDSCVYDLPTAPAVPAVGLLARRH